jgi:hypothetical protein
MDLVIIINMSVIIHYLSYFTEKENNHSWHRNSMTWWKIFAMPLWAIRFALQNHLPILHLTMP